MLEWFAGIGGCAAAVDGRAEVVAAIDQHERAHQVYIRNFPHPAHRWNIVGLRADAVARLGADLWWMSPPCQPFTVRGASRDLDDPRCAPLLRVLALLRELLPSALALENVATFRGSAAHSLVLRTLDRAGYHVAERDLCPGELGIPNKRPRYYLIASRSALRPWAAPRAVGKPLAEYLDPSPDPSLRVEPALRERYRGALAVTDLDHPHPTTYCFTSAYGRSPVYAGSYLDGPSGPRRFSPEEVLRLLHFPEGFSFPPSLPRAHRWSLAGNSLSVAAVREVLRPLLEPVTPAP